LFTVVSIKKENYSAEVARLMNKIILAPPILFKAACSRTIAVLLNLLLILTVSGAAQRLKSVNQPPEDELPTLQRKVKPGLLKVQNTFVYGNNQGVIPGRGALVFDNLYAYVATPNGLFRTPKPLTAASSFEFIGFQNKAIYNLYVHNNTLYVLKYSEETPGSKATDHSFLKSEDHGATFIPMDAALEYCFGGYCWFLTPTEAIFKDNLIFLNAGGGLNLQVSNNNAASWIPLLGTLEAYVCTSSPIELIDTRVLIGGECPLDFAYLRAGTLRPDLLDWLSPSHRPTDVVTPDLKNRNVQFIRKKPNSSDVYAGVELGLLKSVDAGQSFRFVIKYASSGGLGFGPYIRNILYYSKNQNIIVVGGFDKARFHLFLAYSRDNGETWLDITNQTQRLVGVPSSNTTEVDTVQFISEDSDGRLFIGVTHPQTATMHIIQLRLDVAALR
jgi:hypothetical protein